MGNCLKRSETSSWKKKGTIQLTPIASANVTRVHYPSNYVPKAEDFKRTTEFVDVSLK